ncbi:hypothetical protein ACLKA6_005550 [Drosophila palustris]
MPAKSSNHLQEAGRAAKLTNQPTTNTNATTINTTTNSTTLNNMSNNNSHTLKRGGNLGQVQRVMRGQHVVTAATAGTTTALATTITTTSRNAKTATTTTTLAITDMYMLMPRISRLVLIPRKKTIQCSNNFFKLSFKTPKATPTAAPTATPAAITQQNQKHGGNTMVREKSVDTKKKIVEEPPKINIKDQRDKWMAKVSPEMHRKAKAKTPSGSVNKPAQSQGFVSAPSIPSFGMSKQLPREQQRKQPKQTEEDDEDAEVKESSSVADRKNWMNRMHGGQQQKQAQWLKDMQAKQQAGRDM